MQPGLSSVCICVHLWFQGCTCHGQRGRRNHFAPLQMWAKRDRRGIAFDSSAEFLLPNGAVPIHSEGKVKGFVLRLADIWSPDL